MFGETVLLRMNIDFRVLYIEQVIPVYHTADKSYQPNISIASIYIHRVYFVILGHAKLALAKVPIGGQNH